MTSENNSVPKTPTKRLAKIQTTKKQVEDEQK
nr:hypothetical protein [Tanacetum cinerariifolium]